MRIHEERRLEWLAPLSVEIAIVVLLIHKHVRARLKLGEHAQLGIDLVRAGATARNNLRRVAGILKRLQHSLQIIRAIHNRSAAIRKGLNVLLRAAIILNTRKPQ